MAKTPDNPFSPKMLSAMARFDAAYAEWLAARADLAVSHENDTDEATQRRADREDAAVLALATTPAPHSTAVWNKWNFLEHYVAGEVEDGPSDYPIMIVALASLRADITTLGLKPWPDEGGN
jgi:hypothetical protein